VAVAHQRYWQARRMQAVAETSSAHRHAPEAFKLQDLRLAATGRMSFGAAAAGECFPTQPYAAWHVKYTAPCCPA
jgi:hypothetical protein